MPFILFAKSAHSPYAGEEKRNIKALSSEDVEGYLRGYGMGFAKAAELNHYPGPKHVLELAEALRLSEEQLDQVSGAYKRMHKEAVSLGRQIVEKERLLDNLFAEQEIDEKRMRELTIEIGRLQGTLRAVHLRAHLEMKKILTSQQIDQYDELRGYKGNGGKHQPRKHHGGHH